MASGHLCLLVGVLAIALGDLSAGVQPRPESPPPQVSDAVTGGDHGQPFGALDRLPPGYLEEERFFSGTATSYKKTGTWGTDGRWDVAAAGTAPYKVRMLIRRPRDAKRFNGILVVEWFNVSALIEGAADYMQMEEEIVREGYAWVGIGAQNAGVNAPRSGLKAWDPTRYASLVHPGDQYSYDIFSQALQALKHPVRPVLGTLKVRYVIATGRSQSAFRLVTFINAVHPLAPVADGFLVHSRSAAGAGLTADGLGRDADSPVPPGAKLRSDLRVPVLDLVTEGDIINLRAHLTAEPPRPNYRRWELAGAAHAETPLWVVEVPPPLDHATGCLDPVNAAPHHSVVKAALHALARWVKDKMPPAQSPAIEIADPAAIHDPIARDQHGNAKGGIRLPELDAPTATLDGVRNEVAQAPPGTPNFCFLFGHTQPFDAQKLKLLYPSHEAFVKQFNLAADKIVHDGYWLKPEADAARRAAQQSQIGR